MNDKYKLTEETLKLGNHILYRIEALKDFGDVHRGDKGGFVESEKNLSKEGNAWIYDKAKIFDNAKVFGNVKVFGNAQIYDNACISEYAYVTDNACVYKDALVFGNVDIHGNAEICTDKDYIVF